VEVSHLRALSPAGGKDGRNSKGYYISKSIPAIVGMLFYFCALINTMKQYILAFTIIALVIACKDKSSKAKPTGNAWLDSVINSSDTAYKKSYFRKDFVTAWYYVNRKDSTVCQVMKDSSETIRQVIVTKKDTRKYYARYYANGQLEAELPLDETGQYHGTVTNFFENGKIESKGNYTHGLKTGEWKNYDPAGKLISTDSFDGNGQLLKTGN
jgi:hypothetical protein